MGSSSLREVQTKRKPEEKSSKLSRILLVRKLLLILVEIVLRVEVSELEADNRERD